MNYFQLTYRNNIEQSMRFLFSRMAEQNHKLPQNDLLLMLFTIKTQCKKNTDANYEYFDKASVLLKSDFFSLAHFSASYNSGSSEIVRSGVTDPDPVLFSPGSSKSDSGFYQRWTLFYEKNGQIRILIVIIPHCTL